MGVHAGSGQPEYRLRHEGRVQVVTECDILDDESKRAHVVGRRQHIVVVEVDLVLTRRDLVVRSLHVHAHLLERDDDLAPHVLAKINRRQIEVAGGVVSFGRRPSIVPEEEKEYGAVLDFLRNREAISEMDHRSIRALAIRNYQSGYPERPLRRDNNSVKKTSQILSRLAAPPR